MYDIASRSSASSIWNVDDFADLIARFALAMPPNWVDDKIPR
jgi:hypothetical protein